jgi:phenylacetate-CoA ligase
MKSEIFHLKYWLYNRNALSYYQTLINNQKMSTEELMDINWKKRKLIFKHAYNNIEFYRKKYDDVGLTPDDIKSEEDWDAVPPLTKEELKEHFGCIKDPKVRNKDTYLSSTGGSTGVPVKVLHDKRFPSEALGWRMMSWWGLKPGVDGGYVWRMTRTNKVKVLLNKLIWYPTKRTLLNASSMSEDAIGEFVKSYNKINPELLQGYVGAIHHLANFIYDNSIEVNSPKAVWLTSSPISTQQRHLIQKVFEAPVYDQYGCGEVYWLAAECSHHKGLHIFADARHIETLDNNNKRTASFEKGKIAITDLENYAFPIIKYLNGDESRLIGHKCTCGINLPLMEPVKGRITDLIRMPDNSIIAGDYLTTIFDNYPDRINAFQIHQKKDYSINLKVVPEHLNATELNEVLENISTELVKKTKNQVKFDVEIVNEISHDAGKTRFIISDFNTK